MARIRSLKPEFCSSETIAGPGGLTIPCRLHFAMLWTYADDEGRGVDNPRLIKAALWPLDDDITPAEIEAWQTELEAHGRIVRYEVGGRRYFAVTNFTEHQRPSKPQPSKLPEPPPHGCGDVPDCSGNGHGTPSDRSEPSAGELPAVGVSRGIGIGGEQEQGRTTERSGTEHLGGDDGPAAAALDAVVEALMRSRRRHEAAQRHEHPSDWLAGARAGIRREVADTVAALVAEHPDWDAQRLADAVDAPPAPDTRPKVPPARCGECSGTGRVFVADDVADVCPACRGTGFGDGPTLRAVPA